MKETKKLFSVIFFLCLFFISGGSLLFSQETAEDITAEVPEGFIYTLDFIMQFEAGLFLNPEYTELNSSPSPINFEPSIGVLWPNYSHIAIQPILTFFYMNHLWYQDKALPAEIETRTSTTLSFLLQVPAVFSVFLKGSRFQFTAGPVINVSIPLGGLISDKSAQGLLISTGIKICR